MSDGEKESKAKQSERAGGRKKAGLLFTREPPLASGLLQLGRAEASE